jgi:hypothetical protein
MDAMNARTLATVLAAMTALAGTADAADMLRLRGTVVDFKGSTLTMKTREGDTDAVALAAGWKVSGVAPASVADIKPGDFVGIASVSKAEGGDGALEVVIFPAALKGTGEGSRPWDLRPNSRMTNGTVDNAVTDVDGRTVTLSYDNGQRKKIAIPARTPIVTVAEATPGDLKPGVAVFVSATRGADGRLSSGRVVVGNNGIAPPM